MNINLVKEEVVNAVRTSVTKSTKPRTGIPPSLPESSHDGEKSLTVLRKELKSAEGWSEKLQGKLEQTKQKMSDMESLHRIEIDTLVNGINRKRSNHSNCSDNRGVR